MGIDTPHGPGGKEGPPAASGDPSGLYGGQQPTSPTQKPPDQPPHAAQITSHPPLPTFTGDTPRVDAR